MLYAVKLQGIYTAYSYLSVRALWTCRCQKIRSMQFYFSFASLPSAFFLHSLQNRKRTFYYISYKGKLSKKIAKEIQIGYNIK